MSEPSSSRFRFRDTGMKDRTLTVPGCGDLAPAPADNGLRHGVSIHPSAARFLPSRVIAFDHARERNGRTRRWLPAAGPDHGSNCRRRPSWVVWSAAGRAGPVFRSRSNCRLIRMSSIPASAIHLGLAELLQVMPFAPAANLHMPPIAALCAGLVAGALRRQPHSQAALAPRRCCARTRAVNVRSRRRACPYSRGAILAARGVRSSGRLQLMLLVIAKRSRQVNPSCRK